MPIDTILWDWNGTLLDDVDVAVASMNDLLARHGKPLTSREEYREMIDIPVINYTASSSILSRRPLTSWQTAL